MTMAFRAPELLPITEVAAVLRVPVSTLRYWRTRGEGPKSFALDRRVVSRPGTCRPSSTRPRRAADTADLTTTVELRVPCASLRISLLSLDGHDQRTAPALGGLGISAMATSAIQAIIALGSDFEASFRGQHGGATEQPDPPGTSRAEFLMTGEVAEMLRVPPATLRSWRHAGRGPESFRIPGTRHVLYARADDSYIAEGRIAGGSKHG